MSGTDISPPLAGPRAAAVTRAVVWNQVLFTAGNSLVSGGFLLFFAREFGAAGVWIALLAVLPESAGALGLATRWIARRCGGRRAVWLACSMGARLVSLGIPLLAFPALRPVTHADQADFAALDPGVWGTTAVRTCSVCDEPVDQELHQVWISHWVGTDVLPLLVNACSANCVAALPEPAQGYVPTPHTGGPDIVQPVGR